MAIDLVKNCAVIRPNIWLYKLLPVDLAYKIAFRDFRDIAAIHI